MTKYRISIKMNKQDYAAFEGMDFCFEERKEYLSAIEWEYKALAILPKESRVEKAEILQQISEWKRELGDKDSATEASHEAYSLTPPQNVHTSVAYLLALNNNSKFQAIMDFASNLEPIGSVQGGENMLTFLFVERWEFAYEIIGNAARRLGMIDSVEQPMRDALAAVERRISSRESVSSGLDLKFRLQCCLLSYTSWTHTLTRWMKR